VGSLEDGSVMDFITACGFFKTVQNLFWYNARILGLAIADKNI